MPFLRSLLILLALVSSAFCQDGPRDAASAKDAAEALAAYLDGVLKSGGRPDYTKPPIPDLLHRVFNMEGLAALPPPKPSDLAWLLDWTGAANRTNLLMMLFGLKPGENLDQAAVLRNQAECEDQCAASLNFMIYLTAIETPAMNEFMAQLTPEQRTPVREAGMQRARHDAAEMIEGVFVWISQGMKPANERLLTAALRDTGNVWAGSITSDDRTRVLSMLAALRKTVRDDEVQKNLAAFAGTLEAVN
jgi:hypothetical protein